MQLKEGIAFRELQDYSGNRHPDFDVVVMDLTRNWHPMSSMVEFHISQIEGCVLCGSKENAGIEVHNVLSSSSFDATSRELLPPL